MQQIPTTLIDTEKCIGCGRCITVCPSDTLEMHGGKARVTGSTSLNCGHCQAVCPVGAIRVGALETLQFQGFAIDHAWLATGGGDTAGLVRLMASRRSCRNFTSAPVERTLLEDLVTIATTAPSGSNCQDWCFVLLPDRTQVKALGSEVITVFEGINRLARKSWLCRLLSLVGYPQLQRYHDLTLTRMEERIRSWHIGVDRLLYDAPAAILIGGLRDASTPREDALLAAQNLMLAAHTMGLGSCLIGYAVEALRRRDALARRMGVPPGQEIHAVIVLGWPDESYATLIPRRKVRPIYPFQN